MLSKRDTGLKMRLQKRLWRLLPLLLCGALLPPTVVPSPAAETAAADCPSLLDHAFRRLAAAGAPESLCEQHAGKLMLVVNTASYCGFTGQYSGLEALYRRYRERGLVVVGFPSNDFAQEPGDERQISEFCRLTYDVQFPMYEKLSVRGDSAHPFFRQLAERGGGAPSWNFHKYLIDRDGETVTGFPTRVEPTDPTFVAALEARL